jgi:hypothetical protein
MAETIIDGTQFDLTNIMYTSPKASPQGGKSINVLNKKTKTGLRISTPLMLTWGAGEYVDEKTGIGNGKFEMALQFPNDEFKTEDSELFFNNMLAFQNKIKSDALLYSKEWFGKVHKSADIIDELFSPMLKYPNIKGTREPDYNKKPSLKVKLPLWDGVWNCEIYDEDDNRLFPNPSNASVSPLDFLKKGSNVALLIQFGGIWFVNGKFSISWKLVQAVVQKPRGQLTGQCFIKLKKGDKEKLKTAEQEPEEEPEQVSCVVEDSEDEDEDDVILRRDGEEEEEVVAQPQTVEVQQQVPQTQVDEKKKRAVKKR